MRYDFVIIGGGSAGSVLANRLSADPSVSVLVLEAGRPDYWWDVFVHMPAALTFPIGNRFYDWGYRSEPEPGLAGRRIYHARGKVLGGSSSINGMIFQRGNPMDYERWAAGDGMSSWDYAHCLPYFKRMENCLAAAPDDEFRGHDGPLVLERGPATSPLFEAFFAAVQQAGYPLTDDVNGFRQEGFAPFDRNVHRGRRLSAARAYLHPVLDRANLEVRTRVLVRRIRFDGTRATGVEVTAGGRSEVVDAGEVILCGGAINTPQLLMLSGVGPADQLTRHRMPVLFDAPEVGRNLRDHLAAGLVLRVKDAKTLISGRTPGQVARYLLRHTGPLASNVGEAYAFAASGLASDTAGDASAALDRPDLEIVFAPVAFLDEGLTRPKQHGMTISAVLLQPQSHGAVTLVTADPTSAPSIDPKYLSDPDGRDAATLTHGVELCERIGLAAHLAPYSDGYLLTPGLSGAELYDASIRRYAQTLYHPVGTCRMGQDSGSVVDPELRVRGVEGLRVADASVMPTIIRGHTNAPAIVIGERAADLLKEGWRGRP